MLHGPSYQAGAGARQLRCHGLAGEEGLVEELPGLVHHPGSDGGATDLQKLVELERDARAPTRR
ncbi:MULTISPECIES: hypothetical protein [unclassified Methylobacterium]|uniref:hypothetical protein n=1 Tax=unclassified Methylobacterium TaxID=2615210 RepID=UPI0014048BC7|nr:MULTISPECIES: hypothetical protein [unclassified Methylobacterium]